MILEYKVWRPHSNNELVNFANHFPLIQ
ncbi:hypothetical protein F01_200141 [Burkholderia cenocepacia]|nr:hypothetical protein F01_200141 [Burkholderia cenocepacia]